MKLTYDGEPMFHDGTGYSLQPGIIDVGDPRDAAALIAEGLCKPAEGEVLPEGCAPVKPTKAKGKGKAKDRPAPDETGDSGGPTEPGAEGGAE